jgi:3-methylcrotonyl-CoA carboxylase alpha subunit
MEMNTRLQVEHPVTEAICGIDLVEWQLRIASGEKLPLSQKDLKINGHAVEARLYAEDPQNNFLPSVGRLWHLTWPEAVQFTNAQLRIDSGVRPGDSITPHFDPMIAKVIAHGKTRAEALDKLIEGLVETKIAGPKTNLAFLVKLLGHEEFRKEKFDTGFIDKNIADLTGTSGDAYEPVALEALLKNDLPPRRAVKSGWRSPWQTLTENRSLAYTIEFEGEEKKVARTQTEAQAEVVDAGEGVYIINGGQQFFARWPDAAAHMNDDLAVGALKAPMTGKVTIVGVKEGDAVQPGDRLIVIEAMKMEHAVIAKKAGKVAKIMAAVGDQVAQGAPLVEVA